jgi:hypothetical protein
MNRIIKGGVDDVSRQRFVLNSLQKQVISNSNMYESIIFIALHLMTNKRIA